MPDPVHSVTARTLDPGPDWFTYRAEATGLSRESLYRALSAKGNPTLSTTLRVLKALGLRLTVAEPRSVARKAIEAGRQWRGGVTRRKRTMLCDCRRA